MVNYMIIFLKNNKIYSTGDDKTPEDKIDWEPNDIVVVPNNIQLRQRYEELNYDVGINGIINLPNPKTIPNFFSDAEIAEIERITSLYFKRMSIFRLKSVKTQLGIGLDIAGLLAKSLVELFDCIEAASDLEDLKARIANTQLSGLKAKFKEINPELPPEIKGAEETATEFLRFQNDVSQIFKGDS